MTNIIVGIVVFAIIGLVGFTIYRTWHRNSIDDLNKEMNK